MQKKKNLYLEVLCIYTSYIYINKRRYKIHKEDTINIVYRTRRHQSRSMILVLGKAKNRRVPNLSHLGDLMFHQKMHLRIRKSFIAHELQ